MHWIPIFRVPNTNSSKEKKRFTPRNKGVLITTTTLIFFIKTIRRKIKSKKLLHKIAELEVTITRLDGVNDILENGEATGDDQHNLLIQRVELVA